MAATPLVAQPDAVPNSARGTLEVAVTYDATLSDAIASSNFWMEGGIALRRDELVRPPSSLTRHIRHASMLGMALARIAAIALALLSYTTLAQQPEMGSITVTISDQTGAIIPGAQVVVSSKATALRSEAISDGTGEAVLHVYQGAYDLAVKARGFATSAANDLEATKQTHIAVTLRIDQS